MGQCLMVIASQVKCHIEVKCPYAAREMTVRQAAREIRDFCLEFDDTETKS